MSFRRSIRNHLDHTALAMGLLLLGLMSSFAGETNESPRILFLQVKLNADQTLTLVKSTAVGGSVKPTPEIPAGLRYELQDVNGKPLWHATMEDPHQHLAEHAESTGRSGLKSLKVEKTEAEFMVRVPVLTNAAQVAFYQLTNAATNQGAAKLQLGVIPLPQK